MCLGSRRCFLEILVHCCCWDTLCCLRAGVSDHACFCRAIIWVFCRDFSCPAAADSSAIMLLLYALRRCSRVIRLAVLACFVTKASLHLCVLVLLSCRQTEAFSIPPIFLAFLLCSWFSTVPDVAWSRRASRWWRKRARRGCGGVSGREFERGAVTRRSVCTAVPGGRGVPCI